VTFTVILDSTGKTRDITADDWSFSNDLVVFQDVDTSGEEPARVPIAVFTMSNIVGVIRG
jgi:hypothetical protein